MPAHSHGDGTLATDAEAAHSHESGTLATARTGDHRHALPTQAGAVGTGNVVALQETPTAPATNDNPPMSIAGAHAHDVTGRTAGGGAHSHDVTGVTGDTGGGAAHANLQPSLVLHKIIRT